MFQTYCYTNFACHIKNYSQTLVCDVVPHNLVSLRMEAIGSSGKLPGWTGSLFQLERKGDAVVFT
jgi:hypothetical protein